AGVELAAERTDQLCQPPLDRHVDVLVLAPEAEAPGGELALDRSEAALDAPALAAREEVRTHERAHVRDAPRDVVRPELALDGQGRREGLDRRGGRLGEAAGPGRAGGRRPGAPAAGAHPPPARRSTSARMRSLRPDSRMKPAASACW